MGSTQNTQTSETIQIYVHMTGQQHKQECLSTYIYSTHLEWLKSHKISQFIPKVERLFKYCNV